MGLRHDVIHRAAVDPTVNDDSTVLEGTASKYQVGDDWLNTVTNELFECFSLAIGDAVWKPRGSIILNGPVVIGDDSILSPAIINANTNDYDPAGFRDTGVIQVAFLILSSSGNYNLTGLYAPNPAVRNEIVIYNTGLNSITLVNNSILSLANNRFKLKNNIIIQQGEAIKLYYGTGSNRWFALNV